MIWFPDADVVFKGTAVSNAEPVRSCGGSAVPALSADRLATPRLQQLAPREITLKVTDDRPIPEDERRKTEAHLESVLAELFSSAHFSVKSSASNALTIVLDLPGSANGDFAPESCIEMAAEQERHRRQGPGRAEAIGDAAQARSSSGGAQP